ncbi:NAD(P)H-dependent FMN reductase [Poseidonocella pacifica]|uniref:NAD(P)H-dependent FMN reductase n=2 Tax=Poseidonocella pacifica TaxID=871651 RepID=A0A1I0UY43_9RHOB|nr:NAD(P)H-dependent FMN reductase [Poseidonocella pacifica]
MSITQKVLVFAGSNSTQSINQKLAIHASEVLKETSDMPVEIDVLDLNDYEMPIYSPERQAEGIPQLAYEFQAKIAASDALIISLAEYNGSYAAAFKNIFDWCSRIDKTVFQQKPMLLMATSPGPNGARNVHGAAMSGFPFYGGNIVSNFQFGPFGKHFDVETGSLSSPDLRTELLSAVEELQTALAKREEAA